MSKLQLGGLLRNSYRSFEELAQNGLASAKPLLVSSIALRRAEAAFALHSALESVMQSRFVVRAAHI